MLRGSMSVASVDEQRGITAAEVACRKERYDNERKRGNGQRRGRGKKGISRRIARCKQIIELVIKGMNFSNYSYGCVCSSFALLYKLIFFIPTRSASTRLTLFVSRFCSLLHLPLKNS